MRTYIKKFENESEYAAFVNSSGFVTPNVSAWEIESGETVVNFNGTKPDVEVPYVDLGLPSGTLWAKENIKDENGNELYFAWGEVSGYTAEQVGIDKHFDWNDGTNDYIFGPFDWNDSINHGMTKYNNIDNKTTLDADDDAATVKWGSDWKIPTIEQFDELISGTTSAWTQVDSVSGVLLTSKYNDNTLFFPSLGSACLGEIFNGVIEGKYWIDSLENYENDVLLANNFYFSEQYANIYCSSDNRFNGLSVRPVRKNS